MWVGVIAENDHLNAKGSFLYYVIKEGGGGGWPNAFASYFFLMAKIGKMVTREGGGRESENGQNLIT